MGPEGFLWIAVVRWEQMARGSKPPARYKTNVSIGRPLNKFWLQSVNIFDHTCILVSKSLVLIFDGGLVSRSVLANDRTSGRLSGIFAPMNPAKPQPRCVLPAFTNLPDVCLPKIVPCNCSVQSKVALSWRVPTCMPVQELQDYHLLPC
jgi:hypothetical protein